MVDVLYGYGCNINDRLICDICGSNIDDYNVYHCPNSSNQSIHNLGYDICKNCYNNELWIKMKEEINIEHENKINMLEHEYNQVN